MAGSRSEYIELVPRSKMFGFFNSDKSLPSVEYKNINPDSLNDSLSKTPYEIWLLIFGMLDVRSKLNLAMSCKVLGTIANNPEIRKELYKAAYPPIRIGISRDGTHIPVLSGKWSESTKLTTLSNHPQADGLTLYQRAMKEAADDDKEQAYKEFLKFSSSV